MAFSVQHATGNVKTS